MRLSIMIEGHMGLTWPRWQRLVRAAEDLGFHGLYRSDHFANPEGPIDDMLETWISLAYVAAETRRIHFGTLVSPISFRNPSILAWQAAAVDSLAAGRLCLGLGAGWNAREHEMFGFDLPESLDERFARFEEGIKVVRELTGSSSPVSIEGKHHSLKDAMLRPRSPKEQGSTIVIGGNGPKRTLPLVARYADEWNSLYLNNDAFRERSERLDQLLAEEGRLPRDVVRTQMTAGIVKRTDAEVNAETSEDDRAAIESQGVVIGTPNEVVDILGKKAEAGVQEVMLQWLDMDNIHDLELIASEVVPQLR